MSAITIRLPDSLHNGVKKFSRADGYSINAFITSAVAEKLSAFNTERQIREEDKRRARARGLAILASAPDVPPEPGDEIPPGLAEKLGRIRAARKSHRRRLAKV